MSHAVGWEFESPWNHVKLWFDDVRPPPDETWEWAKNYSDAFGALSRVRAGELFEALSLDHDLGNNSQVSENDTRFFLRWIITRRLWPETIAVHSMNPVGREWLEGTIARYRPRE